MSLGVTACMAAVIGYACVYAALPGRGARSARSRASMVLLLASAVLLFAASAMLGAIAWGPVLGPVVVLTAALATGSILLLVAPVVTRGSENVRS